MQGSERPGPRVQHGQWFCPVGVHPQRRANLFDFLSQGIAVYFTYWSKFPKYIFIELFK